MQKQAQKGKEGVFFLKVGYVGIHPGGVQIYADDL